MHWPHFFFLRGEDVSAANPRERFSCVCFFLPVFVVVCA